MTLTLLLTGAFFCYGVYTLQRPGFLLDFMRKFWKLFPTGIHEALFSCGVCVSSFWGIVFLTLNYFEIYLPIYLISFCGICAVLDRAIKFYEYGYKYNPVPTLSNYSYLENAKYRDNMLFGFIEEAIFSCEIIEIGGRTTSLMHGIVNNKNYVFKYKSYDKPDFDVLNTYFNDPYFVLIKGIAFEGNFDALLNFLGSVNCKGFVIEGSLSGISGTQINWIMDRFKDIIIQMPYKVNISRGCPDHCGISVNERIVIVKPV